MKNKIIAVILFLILCLNFISSYGAEGDTVKVTIDGVTYETVVDASGSAEIADSIVVYESSGTIEMSVDSTNTYGIVSAITSPDTITTTLNTNSISYADLSSDEEATFTVKLEEEESSADDVISVTFKMMLSDISLTMTIGENGTSKTQAYNPEDYMDFGTVSGETSGTLSFQLYVNGGSETTVIDYVELDNQSIGWEIDGNVLTYSNLPSGETIFYIGIINDDMLSLVAMVTISTVESSSTGGTSSSNNQDDSEVEDPAYVYNETNQPNSSSDTTLLPRNTTEKDGHSETKVKTSEISALIELAKKHEHDVPEGENEAVIKIEDKNSNGNTSYRVIITDADSDRLVDSVADSIRINTPVGDLRIKTNELEKLLYNHDGNLAIEIVKIEHNGKPAVDASVVVGDNDITNLYTGYGIEIRIPYEPKEGEDLSCLMIEYIDESGKVHIITESRYDAKLGCLIFYVTHLSKYGVSYKPEIFPDVLGTHPFNSSITFLAARGIVTGVENGKFRPDDKVTVAEFITMMTNAFSAAETGNSVIRSYSDVPTDAWYAKSFGWAYLNNISTLLSSNNKINPTSGLSRQDVAVLANNISLSLGLKFLEKSPSIEFRDLDQMETYAQTSADNMVRYGILSVTTSGEFFPETVLTRAEATAVISDLISAMR